MVGAEAHPAAGVRRPFFVFFHLPDSPAFRNPRPSIRARDDPLSAVFRPNAAGEVGARPCFRSLGSANGQRGGRRAPMAS